jgi:hypothetical protein
MKNSITLDVNHPDKKRMEHFLNCVDEKLEQVPFDWHNWKRAEDILAAYQLKNSDHSLTITVIFASSYDDANEIARANSFPVQPNARWSLNGNLLYLVESNDENKVSEILSLFAGKE